MKMRLFASFLLAMATGMAVATDSAGVKDAIYRFLAFFGLIAGIMTIIIPEGFYWNYVTITCHSFFWHTSIVVIGLYLIIANGYAKSIGNFFREWLGAAASAKGISMAAQSTIHASETSSGI